METRGTPLKNPWHRMAPTLITFGCLLCGFSATASVVYRDHTTAGLCILIGYLLDALDVASPFNRASVRRTG